MPDQLKSNRLSQETSPYLLQHANNPVDWYPWGEEALARARAEDKPILLSIGYSACHWCHVMAHESFENPEIAALMNENFVNIKVDREERPDLDTIYMEAVQSISGNGGWPLTVFLTSEGKPFYGGTYFPPEEGRGMPGFPRVLQTVIDTYRNRRPEVDRIAGQIIQLLNQKTEHGESLQPLTAAILDQAYAALSQDFDEVNGGFGQAPKFPQPVTLEFLLRYYLRTRQPEALDMLRSTLVKMARGGIFDQIGGGFHRYSTDNIWLVPHFEKMLYDNALLSRLYLHTYLVTGDPLFRSVTEAILDYVLREMTDRQGGFFSSQDADSAGREGQYYLWTLAEVKNLLDPEKAAVVEQYYALTEEGNFEGCNILHAAAQLSQSHNEQLKQARKILLKEREKRLKPGRDEKILASWNGLMLASLAEAAAAFQRADYLQAAEANGLFLLESLMSEGRLKHSFKDGAAPLDGFLDDYAQVIEGLVALHQATSAGKWLKVAVDLTSVMLEEFWDQSAALFYDSAPDNQALFKRPRNIYDGAVPGGLSSAALILQKIARLSGDERLTEIALQSLRSVNQYLSGYPLSFGNWLCALDLYLGPAQDIAVIGPRSNPATADFRQVILHNWNPNRLTAILDTDDVSAFSELAVLKGKTLLDGRPAVYLCQGHSCQPPVTEPAVLQDRLTQLNSLVIEPQEQPPAKP